MTCRLAGGGDNTGFRGKLLDNIMDGWRNDPVFSPHYHEVGRVSPAPRGMVDLGVKLTSRCLVGRLLQVTGAHSSPEKIAKLRATFERGKREGWGAENEWLDGPEAIRAKFPQLDGADLTVRQSHSLPTSLHLTNDDLLVDRL